MKNYLFPICKVLQTGTLKLFSSWRVDGIENIPPMGPLIIVANHQSNLDPPILGSSINRRVYFLAKSTVFKGRFANWFLRSYGAFPVNRERRSDIGAYKWVLEQLNHGNPVVLFPEGTRNEGAMIKAKNGVAQIAIKSQAPILPIGITGTKGLKSWTRVFVPTGDLHINIGNVFSIPHIEGRPNNEVMDSLTDMIMERIARLLPEQQQGVYQVSHSLNTGAYGDNQNTSKS